MAGRRALTALPSLIRRASIKLGFAALGFAAALAACGPFRGDGPSIGLTAADEDRANALCEKAIAAAASLDRPQDIPFQIAPERALCAATKYGPGRMLAYAVTPDGLAAGFVDGAGAVASSLVADPFGARLALGGRYVVLIDDLFGAWGVASYVVDPPSSARSVRTIAAGAKLRLRHDDGEYDDLTIAQIRDADLSSQSSRRVLGLGLYSSRYRLMIHRTDQTDSAAPTAIYFSDGDKVLSALDQSQLSALANAIPAAMTTADRRIDAYLAN